MLLLILKFLACKMDVILPISPVPKGACKSQGDGEVTMSVNQKIAQVETNLLALLLLLINYILPILVQGEGQSLFRVFMGHVRGKRIQLKAAAA